MLSAEIIWAINLAVNAFYVLLLIRVIFSWLDIRRPHSILMQIHRVAYTVTEPLLRPIRNALMKYQRDLPIDLSPLILYFLVELVRRWVFRAIM